MVYYIVFIIMIIQWIDKTIRNRRISKKFGWKAYKKSFDTFVYGQKILGQWHEIEISRAYNRRQGDFFIDFKSPEEWQTYPNWANDRSTIMKRVSSLFPEHKGDDNEIDTIGQV